MVNNDKKTSQKYRQKLNSICATQLLFEKQPLLIINTVAV